MRKLNKLRQLSWPAKQLLVQSAFLLILVDMALRVKGFKWTQLQLLERVSSVLRQDKLLPSEIATVVDLVAGYLLRDRSCLRRSMLLWWLLMCRGIESELKIGFERQAGKLNGHAWVEIGGQVLNDKATVQTRFTLMQGDWTLLP